MPDLSGANAVLLSAGLGVLSVGPTNVTSATYPSTRDALPDCDDGQQRRALKDPIARLSSDRWVDAGGGIIDVGGPSAPCYLVDPIGSESPAVVDLQAATLHIATIDAANQCQVTTCTNVDSPTCQPLSETVACEAPLIGAVAASDTSSVALLHRNGRIVFGDESDVSVRSFGSSQASLLRMNPACILASSNEDVRSGSRLIHVASGLPEVGPILAGPVTAMAPLNQDTAILAGEAGAFFTLPIPPAACPELGAELTIFGIPRSFYNLTAVAFDAGGELFVSDVVGDIWQAPADFQ